MLLPLLALACAAPEAPPSAEVAAAEPQLTAGLPVSAPPPSRPAPEAVVPQTPSPTVITATRDLAGLDGTRVELEGTYVQVDLRQQKRGDDQFRGHAAVQLDGGRVFLEPSWSPAALRSEAERAHTGKRVRVTGTYRATTPESPDHAAMPQVPCLQPVESVTLVAAP